MAYQNVGTPRFFINEALYHQTAGDYINSVLLVRTKLSLPKLFNQIKLIEKSLGRIKSPKNHPRLCDIDIIDFNGKTLSSNFYRQKIEVPHLNMHKRNFVLIPIFEINHNWTHPKFKKNIVKLLLALSNNDLKSIKFA